MIDFVVGQIAAQRGQMQDVGLWNGDSNTSSPKEVWYRVNPLTAEWALRALIDFTLSNASRFYSSMGNRLDGKGLSVNFQNVPGVFSQWQKQSKTVSVSGISLYRDNSYKT